MGDGVAHLVETHGRVETHGLRLYTIVDIISISHLPDCRSDTFFHFNCRVYHVSFSNTISSAISPFAGMSNMNIAVDFLP